MSNTEGREALSIVHLNVPRALKTRWVKASQARGMKLSEWLLHTITKGEAVKTYPIPQMLASQYHGAGLALAAIANGEVVRLVYLVDVMPAELVEQMAEAGGAHAMFFARPWLATAEVGPTVRELQALGEVSAGMCSAWEFMEL